MRRLLRLWMVCLATFLVSCGGGNGGSKDVGSDAEVEVVDAAEVLEVDAADDPDFVEVADDLTWPDELDLQPETPDGHEVEAEVLPDVHEAEPEEVEPPPVTELGKPCAADEDCDTDGGCLLGFCTILCKDGEDLVVNACKYPAADNPWGPVFGCPADMDRCMPGAVQGVALTCQSDQECADLGLGGFACAAGFAAEWPEAAGRCMPALDRKPVGGSCQGAEGWKKCASLLCLRVDLKADVMGVCSAYCKGDVACPDGTKCAMVPVKQSGGDELLGYAPLCMPYEGSLDECQVGSDCKTDEFCAAIIAADLEPESICIKSKNKYGKWPGEKCSATEPCFSEWCFFQQWGTKVNAYCAEPCEEDAECPEGFLCRDAWLAPFEGLLPPADAPFKVKVCRKVSEGAACFTAEEGVCEYEWSYCQALPGGLGFLGTCVSGDCPPNCADKGCGEDDGCGSPCLQACLPLGGQCLSGAECLSGICVDGVCCESECAGLCESCGQAGMEGFCKPLPLGEDPEVECGACNTCNGDGGCTSTPAGEDPGDLCGLCQACDGAGACAGVLPGEDPGNDCPTCMVCDGQGACGPVPVGEDPMEDCEEMAPETCGFVGLCDGLGTCAMWDVGTVCGSQKCVGNMYSPSPQCDGVGLCAPQPSVSCSPYLCDAELGVCKATCAAAADCVAGNWCQAEQCQPLPACPMETKLNCNVPVPGTTFGQQNTWKDYDACGPGMPYLGPERVYSFKSDKSLKVTLTLTDKGFDPALFLLEAACSPQYACVTYADAQAQGTPETLEFTAAKGVQYHIAVDAAGAGVKGDFTLAATCCEMKCAAEKACGDDGCGGSCGTCGAGDICHGGQCKTCAEDPAGEPNDECAKAALLTAGNHKGFLLCEEGDIDWFKFDLNEGDTLSTVLSFDTAALNLDLQLYGPGCDKFLVASESLDKAESIERQVTQKGTYYLMVYSPDLGVGGYDLSLFADPPECTKDTQCKAGKVCGLYQCVTPPAGCTTLSELSCGSVVDGNTSGKANKMVEYDKCTESLYGGPEDMYVLNPAQEMVVTLAVMGQPFAAVLSALEKHCASSWACKGLSEAPGAGMGTAVKFKAKAATPYYLVVDGVTADDGGPYTLSVDCCVPQCDGKQCGPDDCGMECGLCPGAQDACVDGQCVCQPDCAGKMCGDDGCGGSCGDCPGPQDACVDGQCVCQPDCAGKMCGDDGCGGSCGDCPGPQDACIDNQCVCQPDCAGKVCGDDGCGGSCGDCPGPQDACTDGQCVCQPGCEGKVCGDDGCGGGCGTCAGPQEECLGGQCICQPACQGKMCGDDGCNGSCGTCGKVESCQNFKCTCSTDGGFEPNNTCTKPVSVMPGTYPNLSICTGGDQDWYLFSLLPGQTAKVQILFKQVDGDLDLYLYKQGNCSGYLASSASSTDNEELSYKSATQSSYLIRVVGYSANVSNSYTLVLTVQ